MPPKGLSAFLKKQKEKTAHTKTDVVDQSNTTAETNESKMASSEPKVLDDKPVAEKLPEESKRAKQESSDEEEDDLELNTGKRYGNIQEKEEAAVTQAEEETKNAPAFSMEADEAPAKEVKKKKNTASEITFGGRPRFMKGNRAAAVAMDKGDGELEDLLNEGPVSKKEQKKQNFMLARSDMNTAKPTPVEPEVKKGPVKPTFRGKLSLKGAGADTAESGVKTDYGFAVTYKTEHGDNDEKSEVKKEKKPQAFSIGGPGRLGGLAAAEASIAGETRPDVDEDGFKVVDGNERKARRQAARRDDADGFEEEPKSKGFTRGGAFAAMNE